MITNDARYAGHGLIQDMLATPELIRGFDCDRMRDMGCEIAAAGRLLLTGEGSSRLFPTKSLIAHGRRQGWELEMHTEAGLQAREYNLRDWAVLALSNSGRTAEVIGLFEALAKENHPHRYSLCAFPDSKLESKASRGFVLTCGEERAVAATKSVIEQTLFLRALLEHAVDEPRLAAKRDHLAAAFHAALTTRIDPQLIQRVAAARTIYWAGRNDGVAEELTLKTNEISRKSADFLEGTYAVHGIEEVMDAGDVVIWVDPYAGSEEKFDTVLARGVGVHVIAIASRPTRFPTVVVPDAGDLDPFVQMAAGWNLIVDVGLSLGVNLDKPLRARKVGNEFQ